MKSFQQWRVPKRGIYHQRSSIIITDDDLHTSAMEARTNNYFAYRGG
ncbi:MAG: hypothetical protein J6Q33_07140 [Alistipes sp.]|nr:hypothetical protein [Alistipes sp.]